MALPTIQKTWQYDVNNLITPGTEAATNAAMMWQIKNAMVNFNSFPWTVAGSSNGSGSFGMDAVDRWITSSNLRFASSGNISWIVLEQEGIDGYFQLLISGNVTSSLTYNVNMSFSKGGLFTGGSATAPPTAADAISIKSNAAWGGSANGANITAVRVSVIQSDDGECTRVFLYKTEHSGGAQASHAPYLCGFWMFDKIQEPSNGWATPYICCVVGDSSSRLDIGVIANFTSAFVGIHNSTTMAASPSWEGSLTGTAFSTYLTSHNKISGQYQLFPVGIASTTVGARGRHGQIYDMWWGNAYLPDGTKFTDGAQNDDFVKIGPFVMPWPSNVELLRS